ncbi:hypothetical protein [Vibrio penaeicida]|uniref:hypothetical protein n=1 Tax=Vibrio penaeicida TaxID=104609 RepID=UPI000CEA19AB|nr:hypothetical protein [Vibrio penaeicida]
MENIDQFTIQPHKGNYETRPLESCLFYSGRPLDFNVPGYVIEEQYECDGYFLLLLSWDCVFEEGCEVVVISKSFDLVGKCSITPYYNSYVLSSVTQLGSDLYQLTFNHSEYFELTVNYPKKCWYQRTLTLRKS